jgi:hypothetical protein
MKKIISFALLLSLPIIAFSQSDDSKYRKINAQFYWSNVGANISLAYEFNFKKIAPFAGVMYHINTSVRDLAFHQYKHRFYNKNVVDGVGINFGFIRPINIRNSDLGLYFLFVNQVSHMHNRYLLAHCDTNSINYQVTRGPDYFYISTPSQMWIVENNIGLGINIKAYSNLYLNASAAFGIASYMVKNKFTNHEFFRDSEISEHFRIGFSYVLPSN